MYCIDRACGTIVSKNIIHKRGKHELNYDKEECSIELIIRTPLDDGGLYTIRSEINEIFDKNMFWDFQQSIIKKAIQKTKEEIKKIL